MHYLPFLLMWHAMQTGHDGAQSATPHALSILPLHLFFSPSSVVSSPFSQFFSPLLPSAHAPSPMPALPPPSALLFLPRYNVACVRVV